MRGEDYCSPVVVAQLLAVARHETSLNTSPPFDETTNNYGAMQCGKRPVDGVCPDNCFPSKDSSPTASGQVTYLACFQSHPVEADGALAFAKLLTVQMRGVAKVLPAGDLQKTARAMYDAGYFEGFGDTIPKRVRGYAVALDKSARSNSVALGEPYPLTLPAEVTPDIYLIGGGLAAFATLAVGWYLARRQAVDAQDDADPHADDPIPGDELGDDGDEGGDP